MSTAATVIVVMYVAVIWPAAAVLWGWLHYVPRPAKRNRS